MTSRQGKTKSQISKSKSDLSGKANKSKDSDAGFLADKATQTEIFVPEREKSKEEIETDKALRKLSLTIIPEDALEHFEKDEEVNWVRSFVC